MKYPDWILREAFRRSGWGDYSSFTIAALRTETAAKALVEACAELAAAGLIREPISPELRAAREQYAEVYRINAVEILRGERDKALPLRNRLATIERYKELLNAEA